MPAHLIEPEQDELSDDILGGLVVSPDAKPDAKEPDGKEPNATSSQEPELPQEYQGKSTAELVQIIEEKQSMIGRQTTEVGQLRGEVNSLRGLVDRAVSVTSPGNAEDPGQPIEDEDFIRNPKDAVSRTVQQEVADLRAGQAQLDQKAAGIEFASRYPSAATDVTDQKFIDFVSRSPMRGDLAQRAFADPKNVDFQAAGELWALYTDYQSMNASEQNREDAAAAQTDANASQAPSSDPAPALVNSTGSAGGTADGGQKKEIFSEAKLQELSERNPDYYWRDDIQLRISAAWREGRVKRDLTPSL